MNPLTIVCGDAFHTQTLDWNLQEGSPASLVMPAEDMEQAQEVAGLGRGWAKTAGDLREPQPLPRHL